MSGRGAVSDDQGGRAGAVEGAVRAEPFERQPPGAGALDDVVRIPSRGQLEHGVHARRDAGDACTRRLLAEQLDEPAAPSPVPRAALAHRTAWVRRRAVIAMPSGNWWAGVSRAACAPPNSSTTAPSASIGASRTSRPRADARLR